MIKEEASSNNSQLTEEFLKSNGFVCHHETEWCKTVEDGNDLWNIVVIYSGCNAFYLNIDHLSDGFRQGSLEEFKLFRVSELQQALRLFGLNELADNLK